MKLGTVLALGVLLQMGVLGCDHVETTYTADKIQSALDEITSASSEVCKNYCRGLWDCYRLSVENSEQTPMSSEVLDLAQIEYGEERCIVECTWGVEKGALVSTPEQECHELDTDEDCENTYTLYTLESLLDGELFRSALECVEDNVAWTCAVSWWSPMGSQWVPNVTDEQSCNEYANCLNLLEVDDFREVSWVEFGAGIRVGGEPVTSACGNAVPYPQTDISFLTTAL